MERLTYFKDGHWRLDFGGVQYQADFVYRLAAYENTGWEPEQIKALGVLFDFVVEESKSMTEQFAMVNRLRELAVADQEGRVVVLKKENTNE